MSYGLSGGASLSTLQATEYQCAEDNKSAGSVAECRQRCECSWRRRANVDRVGKNLETFGMLTFCFKAASKVRDTGGWWTPTWTFNAPLFLRSNLNVEMRSTIETTGNCDLEIFSPLLIILVTGRNYECSHRLLAILAMQTDPAHWSTFVVRKVLK